MTRETVRGAAAWDPAPMPAHLAGLVFGVHEEVHKHSRTGVDIRISCACSIGHDHTFEEWLSEANDDDVRDTRTRYGARRRLIDAAEAQPPSAAGEESA